MSSLHDISLPSGWSLQHSSSHCGGPVLLSRHGIAVLSDMHSQFDHFSDQELVASSARFFHKGGQSVAQCEGKFSASQGIRLRQINRYAGNVGRVTLDLNWPAGRAVKSNVECGSVNLDGEWRRLLVVPDWESFRDGQQAQWHGLTPGQTLNFSPLPLAVVAERNDGLLIEMSLGFDIWRWQHALGNFEQGKSMLCLQVEKQTMTFQRQLLAIEAQEEAEEVEASPETEAAPDAGEMPEIKAEAPAMEAAPEAAVVPVAREYRFCSQFAWLHPDDKPGREFPEAMLSLAWAEGGQGLIIDSDAAKRFPVTYVIDFAAMPVVKTALRNYGAKLPCWESNATQGAARRAIRQIAALGNSGFLCLRGLTPGLCSAGVHCNRKQDTPHWDLQGILTFAAWARQALGDQWHIAAPQELAPWQSMPSLADPFAVTGFRVMSDD